MALPKEEHVTYADYLSWGEDVRCEVIDGRVISYNFSPSRRHQDVLGNLHFLFRGYLEGKSCRVTLAPFDVYLFADESGVTKDTDNWVEPDLFVVCDQNKYGENELLGAPDLVIEVLSPSNAKNDKIYKMNQYEKAGVKEYWIVDPLYEMVDVYLLKEGRLQLERAYAADEVVEVNLFEDLSIDLKRVFSQ